MKHVSVFLAALAGILVAQSAHAVDVRATSLQLSDAETGERSHKFGLGRKIAIRCDYEYVGSATMPAWQVVLQVDGLTVGIYTAQVPPPSPKIPTPLSSPTITKFSVQAVVTPEAAGEHKATCLLDPIGKLKGVDSDPKNNSRTSSFAVDVTPRVSSPAESGPVTTAPGGPVTPPKATAPQGSGPVAQTPPPVIVPAAMKLKLEAQPLANCGSNQDVVAVTGTLNNAGQGIAVIPAGKEVIKINAAEGVYGAGISISASNLSSGQSVPVNANLKAKGTPSNLAGATLKLVVFLTDAIPNAWGDKQVLTVAFPANFCKSPTATTGDVQPPTPGRSPAK